MGLLDISRDCITPVIMLRGFASVLCLLAAAKAEDNDQANTDNKYVQEVGFMADDTTYDGQREDVAAMVQSYYDGMNAGDNGSLLDMFCPDNDDATFPALHELGKSYQGKDQISAAFDSQSSPPDTAPLTVQDMAMDFGYPLTLVTVQAETAQGEMNPSVFVLEAGKYGSDDKSKFCIEYHGWQEAAKAT